MRGRMANTVVSSLSALRRRMALKSVACSGPPIASACVLSPPTSRSTCCGASSRAWAREAAMPFEVLEAPSSSILSKTTGFIAEAGFTHSLTPARNCTFGCTYCYVPSMRIYGGLKQEDWRHWGQFTTFKSNAAELLRRQLRGDQVIYCSPLVDPYQPAEEAEQLMPRILDELSLRPPKVFVIQTRGPLIVRDLARLVHLGERTTLRVSFSITTNRA